MNQSIFNKTSINKNLFLVLFVFSLIGNRNALANHSDIIKLKTEESVTEKTEVGDSENSEVDPSLSVEEKEAAKDKSLKLAFVLLSGVIFIGGFAIFLILLWGYRVRRVIREPLVPSKKIDPLWFLKSKNDEPQNVESVNPDAESDESKSDE